MTNDNPILVATSKGLIKLSYNLGESPQIEAIYFPGFNVTMIYQDERIDRWWAGITHKHWGQKLHYSGNQGESWHEASVPSFEDIQLPNGKPAALKQIWCMQHAGEDNPESLWLGTEPAGLFYSEDNGNSFRLLKSLWEHPSRLKEEQWFGTSSEYPFLHSIAVDPLDSKHIYVAISSAGVFETNDRGKAWDPRNSGLVATYLPNPNAKTGHDPHLLLLCKSNPQVLWQQNHCGIFYSKNAGMEWVDVSVKEGIPNYGFALAIDDKEPGSAWVIPAVSDDLRVPPDYALQVFKTDDFGRQWKSMSKGLPSQNAFDIVLRQAFAKKDDLLIFGTNNGNLYWYSKETKSWKSISTNLPKVNAVVVC